VRRKFHEGEGSFSGLLWSFEFGVRYLWRKNLKSYLYFQTNVFAKFVDTICVSFHTNSSYFMCYCTEYRLSVLQAGISEENKFNARTQQLITAKMSGLVIKQGSKTYASLSLTQLQNQVALMSRRIQTVKHRKCAAGLASAHPGLQDWILLNYTAENAHKVRKKTFDFLLCIELQQTFGFTFSWLRHYQMPEYFHINNCCF